MPNPVLLFPNGSPIPTPTRKSARVIGTFELLFAGVLFLVAVGELLFIALTV
jgi:hypothetical protein